MPKQNYIAVDLGAESGRVMLASVGDETIALQEAHRFPNTPAKVGATWHWDILRLWNDVTTGIGKAVTLAGGAANVAGIGVDTWGVDFGLFDEAGALLGNPVCYRDERTAGVPEKVFAKLPREKLYAISGIQSMFFNSLFQLAALRLADAPTLRNARRILFMPDIFNYWLSGKMANEYTMASTSMLLDARQRAWSPDLLNLIGVQSELFPEMVFPARAESQLGTVTAAAGEAIGAAGIPVLAVGGHDTASAFAAVPATSMGDWLCMSSGTWSLLGVETAEPVLTEKAAALNVTNEGGIGGTIRLLKNIAGMYPLQECRREWSRQGQDLDYATLVSLAANAPGHTAILNLADQAFLTPGQMPQKIVAHCTKTNQRVPTNPGEFTRVILESLAVCYAQVARELAAVTGKKFTKLHIMGGGSQNDLLNQMAADATGLTVLAGPVEATALGNVLSQAISTGQIASIAAGRALILRGCAVRDFSPRDSAAWRKWAQ